MSVSRQAFSNNALEQRIDQKEFWEGWRNPKFRADEFCVLLPQVFAANYSPS